MRPAGPAGWEEGAGVMDGYLYRVTAPYYVAGFIACDGKVLRAAPIIKWLQGRSLAGVLDYFARRGWPVEQVGD